MERVGVGGDTVTTTVIVHGPPVSWKRPQRARQGHTYTEPKVKAWMDTFGWEAKVAHAGEPWTGPLWALIEIGADVVCVTFGQVGEEGVAAFGASRPRGVRGDLDNYVKAVLDAGEGIVYQNDRQVVAVHAGFVAEAADIGGRR